MKVSSVSVNATVKDDVCLLIEMEVLIISIWQFELEIWYLVARIEFLLRRVEDRIVKKNKFPK